MTLKVNAKYKERLMTYDLKNDSRNLVNFDLSRRKSGIFALRWALFYQDL